MPTRRNFPSRIEARRKSAAERDAARATMTTAQKLAALPPTGATRERNRLTAKLEHEAASAVQQVAREKKARVKKDKK